MSQLIDAQSLAEPMLDDPSLCLFRHPLFTGNTRSKADSTFAAGQNIPAARLPASGPMDLSLPAIVPREFTGRHPHFRKPGFCKARLRRAGLRIKMLGGGLLTMVPGLFAAGACVVTTALARAIRRSMVLRRGSAGLNARKTTATVARKTPKTRRPKAKLTATADPEQTSKKQRTLSGPPSKNPSWQLLDRPRPGTFSGESEPIDPVLPGPYSLAPANLLPAPGNIKRQRPVAQSRSSLESTLRTLAEQRQRKLVSFCGSGVTRPAHSHPPPLVERCCQTQNSMAGILGRVECNRPTAT